MTIILRNDLYNIERKIGYNQFYVVIKTKLITQLSESSKNEELN